MKKFLVCALAAVGMVACVNEDVVQSPKSDVISFADAFIVNATRAEVAADPSTTKATLEAFDVWAYMSSVDGTVLVDEDVERNGTSWDYANLQYWTPNKNYFFAALAPMNSNNWDLDASEAVFDKGAGLVTFENIDGSEDLIYATASVATPDMATLQNKGMDAVKFQFQHLLSKVKFTFKNGFLTDNATVKIENITMTAPASGEINLSEGSGWVLDDEDLTLEFGNVGELSKAEGKVNSAQCDRERLTIPADETYTYNIEFDVTLYYGTEEAFSVHKEAVVTDVALEMGKAYNFVAEINPDNLNLLPIVFDVQGVDAWVPEGGQQVDVDYYYDAESNTYSVATATGLQEVAAKINAGELTANVTLMNDIVLPTTRSAEGNWTPLGLSTKNSYRGTFDGNGYTIENMVCNGADVAGLIGYTYNATVKNVTIKNATINSNHYAGGIVAWVNNLPGNTKIPFVVENCHVLNSTITSTPELVNGAYDNGDKAGGLIGAAWFTKNGVRNAGTQVANCSVKNTTIKAYRDLGGLFGLAQGVNVENCVLEDVTVEQDLTNGYQDTEPTTVGNVIGRDSGYNEIDGSSAVSTGDELVATLAAGKDAYLLSDIVYSGTIAISKDMNAVIDLGGNTLSSTDETQKNYELIKNAGTLLVKNGTMKVEATINSGWARYSAVIANVVGGNLTVENVNIEHLGGTDMAYGIDNLTNGKGTYAVTTIDNSTVKSPYRAVRQFLNGIEATNELYVKAGSTLEGTNKSIFFHDPSTHANSGKLVVEEGAELKGDVYLFVTAGSAEWPVEVSIAASALVGESAVTSGNVPAGYAVELVDGNWTVVK